MLETRLARAHWTNVENRDAVKTYNKVTVADLAKQFPGFDWDAWTTELGVSSVPAVVVNQPSYLKALAATVNELPVDAWKPYLEGVAAQRLRAVSQQGRSSTPSSASTTRRCAA